MSNTKNLGLKLTAPEETSVLFKDWRDDINGTKATSNMQIIDEAVGNINEAVGNIDEAVGKKMQYNGDVANFASLPANPKIGDMYRVLSDARSPISWQYSVGSYSDAFLSSTACTEYGHFDAISSFICAMLGVTIESGVAVDNDVDTKRIYFNVSDNEYYIDVSHIELSWRGVGDDQYIPNYMTATGVSTAPSSVGLTSFKMWADNMPLDLSIGATLEPREYKEYNAGTCFVWDGNEWIAMSTESTGDMIFCGDVRTFADLPSGAGSGDVYRVTTRISTAYDPVDNTQVLADIKDGCIVTTEIASQSVIASAMISAFGYDLPNPGQTVDGDTPACRFYIQNAAKTKTYHIDASHIHVEWNSDEGHYEKLYVYGMTNVESDTNISWNDGIVWVEYLTGFPAGTSFVKGNSLWIPLSPSLERKPTAGSDKVMTSNDIKAALDKKSDVGHTHSASDLTNAVPANKGGVPTGGVAGQILTKKSSSDYDSEWRDNQDIRYLGEVDISNDLPVSHGIGDTYKVNGSKTLIYTDPNVNNGIVGATDVANTSIVTKDGLSAMKIVPNPTGTHAADAIAIDHYMYRIVFQYDITKLKSISFYSYYEGITPLVNSSVRVLTTNDSLTNPVRADSSYGSITRGSWIWLTCDVSQAGLQKYAVAGKYLTQFHYMPYGYDTPTSSLTTSDVVYIAKVRFDFLDESVCYTWDGSTWKSLSPLTPPIFLDSSPNQLSESGITSGAVYRELYQNAIVRAGGQFYNTYNDLPQSDNTPGDVNMVLSPMAFPQNFPVELLRGKTYPAGSGYLWTGQFWLPLGASVDVTPTQDSANPIASGAVYSSLVGKMQYRGEVATKSGLPASKAPGDVYRVKESSMYTVTGSPYYLTYGEASADTYSFTISPYTPLASAILGILEIDITPNTSIDEYFDGKMVYIENDKIGDATISRFYIEVYSVVGHVDADGNIDESLVLSGPTNLNKYFDNDPHEYLNSEFHVWTEDMPLDLSIDECTLSYNHTINTAEGTMFVWSGTAWEPVSPDVSIAAMADDKRLITSDAVYASVLSRADRAHTHNAAYDITGVLKIDNGGTGVSSWSTNRIVYASSTKQLKQITFPSSGASVLTQGSNGTPYWTPLSSVENTVSSVLFNTGDYEAGVFFVNNAFDTSVTLTYDMGSTTPFDGSTQFYNVIIDLNKFSMYMLIGFYDYPDGDPDDPATQFKTDYMFTKIS